MQASDKEIMDEIERHLRESIPRIVGMSVEAQDSDFKVSGRLNIYTSPRELFEFNLCLPREVLEHNFSGMLNRFVQRLQRDVRERMAADITSEPVLREVDTSHLQLDDDLIERYKLAKEIEQWLN